MTDTAQTQHAAQSTHSADFSPSNSNKPPPIQEPINSAHVLAKYTFTCRVDSVYYHRDSKNSYANVLLDLGFDLADVKLSSATVRIRALNIRMLDGSPGDDEVTKIVSVDCPASEAGVLLLLRPFVGRTDINRDFYNDNSHYVPTSVKILLVATKRGRSSSHLPFHFALHIPPTLEVRVKRGAWWHFWTTRLRPKKGHSGWSCVIQADYRPDIVKNILLEYQKPEGERETSRTVGLRAAVTSFFKTMRKPSSS